MDRAIVFKSLDPAAAELVCSRLRAAGFHAEVEHELSATTATGWTLGAGGIRVAVPAGEAVDAKALLDAENSQA
ncbi:MAG TPA: hypothetical protein VEH27_07355 [Methylomirabilota bacterium]|nr:hypothetical protein [Methylomirabilota bacterium]